MTTEPGTVHGHARGIDAEMPAERRLDEARIRNDPGVRVQVREQVPLALGARRPVAALIEAAGFRIQVVNEYDIGHRQARAVVDQHASSSVCVFDAAPARRRYAHRGNSGAHEEVEPTAFGGDLHVDSLPEQFFRLHRNELPRPTVQVQSRTKQRYFHRAGARDHKCMHSVQMTRDDITSRRARSVNPHATTARIARSGKDDRSAPLTLAPHQEGTTYSAAARRPCIRDGSVASTLRAQRLICCHSIGRQSTTIFDATSPGGNRRE